MTPRARVSGILLATSLLALSACSSDSRDAAPAPTVATVPPSTLPPTTVALPLGDIVAVALTNAVFVQLAGMVADAGLIETLRGTGPFTVFAPMDDAFEALPLETLHTVQDDKDLLTTVLTYHVVVGKYTVDDLKKVAAEGGKLPTVAGPDLTVAVDGDTVTINGNPILIADVPATNGVVHAMGAVLLPPS